MSIQLTGRSGNVSTLAHIFGFLFGVVMAWLIIRSGLESHFYHKEAQEEMKEARIDEAAQLIVRGEYSQARKFWLDHLSRYSEDRAALIAGLRKTFSQN